MLHLFNTLTRQIEEFKPLNARRVGLYTCGPTVYNFAHLGNLRTYIFEDILKRVLLYQGLKVKQVMNLTDVDDKTIKASREAKQSLKSLTDKFTKLFKQDIKELNILSPTLYAPTTHYILEMVQVVEKLLKKGVAYQKEGSIYFSINKFKDYGRLSQLDKRELKVGARVDADEYEKENPADFVLWKAWTAKDGRVFWRTKLGQGRPGWHLECSAISITELGQPFDIHAGAVDLIFPHHENEIAQSEAAAGRKFVNYWLHGEHLLVEGQKMAKSFHNFYTLRDLEERGFHPLAYRYLVLTAHYRSQLNFTWESLAAAQSALNKLYAAVRDWKRESRITIRQLTDELRTEFEKKFIEAVNDDLDMPRALSVLWEMIDSSLPASVKAELILDFDRVLGLDIKKYLGKKIKIPQTVRKLAAEREKARQAKDWVKADEIRRRIEAKGFMVEDTADGPRLIAR